MRVLPIIILFSQVTRALTFKLGFGLNPNNRKTVPKIIENLKGLGSNPRLEEPNEYGQLTWYPIGFKNSFKNDIPTKVTIRDKKYIVWKSNNQYYSLNDVCSHQGSSFLNCETMQEKIVCPYHGYTFDGENGHLLNIPGLSFMDSQCQHIQAFKVVEKADMVYLNTVPVSTPEEKEWITEDAIYVEPEFNDISQRVVCIQENFEHYAKFVSVNSLDICHIGFVHTFGNRESPNPLNRFSIKKIDDVENHYRVTYEYMAGKDSLVNKIFNYNNLIVENEYILPHTTVARIKFGGYTSTIITYALPESMFKTRLFVKAYRSYWNLNLEKKSPLYSFVYILNVLGDLITKYTMESTLKQDKAIVDNIDKTSYQGMHGKFSIIYDMFSNHYKNNYRELYEN
jgi:phenylpropionate dioxygenase-like ring-hydroxylating dioxygenase large terminal subunit